MPHDVLHVIEAAYRLELSPASWIHELGEAAYRELGTEMGLLAMDYRVGDDLKLSVGEIAEIEMPGGMGPAVRESIEALPPAYVRDSFVHCACATQSEAGKASAEIRERNAPLRKMLAEAFGWHDAMIVSGMEPHRYGVYLGAWLPKETTLRDTVRRRWHRVSVHLGTALRLRSRLRGAQHETPESPDAVFTPGGKLEHAGGEAVTKEARLALHDAVVQLEKARGKARRSDPDSALAAWKGLVSARWTLVDQFQSRGERFVVARRNDVGVSRLEPLSAREQQALSYASLGHTNKLIAYEMGISASTVSVLLHRAARKLNATGREDLVAKYAARSARHRPQKP